MVDIKIKISGYEFKKLESFNLTQRVNNFAFSNFSICLNSTEENKYFLNVDLRDFIQVYFDDQLKFTGHIKQIKTTENTEDCFDIYCEDFFGPIGSPKITSLETRIPVKISGPDMIALLADIGEIGYSEETIDGLHIHSRPFSVIIPILNIKTNEDIEIRKIRITKKIDVPFITESKALKHFDTFAILELTSETFFKAIIAGIDFIKCSLNILNFRNNIPIIIQRFNYLKSKSGFRIGNAVYVKDIENSAELITKIPWDDSFDIEINQLSPDYLTLVIKLGNRLLTGDLTKDKKVEMLILKYLNSAELNTDRTEAFLDLWISLDFLISRIGVENENKFSKEDIKEIKEYCSSYCQNKQTKLNELVKSGRISSEEHEKKDLKYKKAEDRLLQLLGLFNQLSLMNKLEIILRKYKLDLSDQEWEVYRRARHKRNEIIHGHVGNQPTQEELNIISKLIYFIFKKVLIDTSDVAI